MYQFEVRTDGLTTIDIVNRDTGAEVIEIPFHTGFLVAVCASALRLNVDPTIVTTEDARDAVRELRRLIPRPEEDEPPEGGFVLHTIPVSYRSSHV